MSNNLKYTEEEIGNVFENDAFHEHCQRPIMEAKSKMNVSIRQHLKNIKDFVDKSNPTWQQAEELEVALLRITEDIIGL